MSKGKLYLLPNVLEESQNHHDFLPQAVDRAVSHIDGLIAESEKGARAFLKRFSFKEGKSFRDIPICLLNEHSKPDEVKTLLKPLLKGETWGLISDCGLPCFADPGSALVDLANHAGVPVEAFVGPSSLILALLLSGFSAQSFSFHGYLPQDKQALAVALKSLEESARKATQLFIEAPYRNDKLLAILLETLKPKTRLCVAIDLTMPTQEVYTASIEEWKKRSGFTIGKRPAIFIISAN